MPRRFLVGLLALFILTFLASSSLAQEKKNPTPTPTPTPRPKVEYTLPYPGILPGHPLYPLKMVRDRVVGWFITDPLKKAEYNLLLADKRLNSGLFLLEKGEMALAESTFSKGENYLEMALSEAEKAQKEGKDASALLSKLSLATLKHREVLSEVLEKFSGSTKEGAQKSLGSVQKSLERIQEMQKKRLQKRLEEKRLGRGNLGVGRVEAKNR